jgi:hypothetical protein
MLSGRPEVIEMVTSRMARAFSSALVLVAACSGRTATEAASAPPPGPGGGAGSGSGLAPLPPDTVDPGGSGPQYPGTGFRVHEWGTNTIVVGSDGTMQRGLHHEEEDLPSFVYDRRRQDLAADPALVKMETPVTYFYSDKPMTATVSVSFPKGVLSQWYPAVQSFYPPFFKGMGDPALDPGFPFTTQACRSQFTAVLDGNLSWGTIEVLARGAAPAVPDAPLDRFTWSHARAVASNALGVPTSGGGTQNERFLFYRGLGNFPLALTVAAQAGAAGYDGGLLLTNGDAAERVGAVFVLRVTADQAAFVVHAGGVAPGASLAISAPAPEATQPLDAYAQDLAKAMVAELDKSGLYHDESVAMVKTWARQWFRTPGVRVLYLAPQAWTDAQIPLSVDPAPVEKVRVMVVRVEAITRAEEDADQKILPMFDGDVGFAQQYFQGFGRFAEPRLRRALALAATPPPGALAFLQTIAGANVDLRAGE